MQQRPDHPHMVAVHLMKSMKCCKDCQDGGSNEADLRQLMELQIRKETLAEQLRVLTAARGEPIHVLQNDIIGLEQLIAGLRVENEDAYNAGKAEVDRLVEDRSKFQKETKSEMVTLIEAETVRNKEMHAEVEGLMEKIRQLHRVNNELIYNFCNY